VFLGALVVGTKILASVAQAKESCLMLKKDPSLLPREKTKTDQKHLPTILTKSIKENLFYFSIGTLFDPHKELPKK